MNETYEVGEIALLATGGNAGPMGAEVTITTALEPYLVRQEGGEPYWISWYTVDNKYFVEPHELRKRRPPQDWTKLLALDSVPAEGVVVRKNLEPA